MGTHDFLATPILSCDHQRYPRVCCVVTRGSCSFKFTLLVCYVVGEFIACVCCSEYTTPAWRDACE